jgi:outer membrane protein OmpA-like peptidoglycan-associated protein
MVAVLIVGSLGDTGEEVQPSTELSSAAAVTTRGDVGSATTAEPEAVTTEPAAVDDTIEPAAPVAVSVEGGQVILEGVVESEDLRHSFFVAVSQLTGDETTVDNRLRVEPGAGARLEISLRVADSVLFELGSADISEEFAALLDQVASVLDLVPEARVQVGGHTDLSGSDEVNQVLSTARATAVVDYLVAEGVSPERLEAVGYGSSRPVADNATPEGRRANRRIEIDLIT